MIQIGIDVDDSQVRAGLRALRKVSRGRLRPLFVRLREPLRQDLQKYAEKASSPDGAWPKRSAKSKGSRRRLLGKLPRAVSVKAQADALVGLSKVRWSAAHNEGAKVGHGAVIPARPFLFLSQAFLDLAEKEVADYLITRGWEQG